VLRRSWEILQLSKIDFDDELVDYLVKKRIDAELELSDKVTLREGAFALLIALKGKVKLALVLMSNKPVIDRMLTACGLRMFFDVVLSVDEVHNPNPNPEIFLRCASKLKLSSEQGVVLEESVVGLELQRRRG
jgi:beta-phosphoglucomutase-like phosphatase (HAD superfamily)